MISVDLDAVGILKGVSFTLQSGTIVGLIGPNGSGKTTLLNVISGLLPPTTGQVRLGAQVITGRPHQTLARMGIFRSFQEGRLFDSLTAAENIAVAFRPPPDERLSSALALRARADPHAEARAAAVALGMRALGVPVEDDIPAAEMSYGQRKRTIMAQALASNSVVCLLDEPLAGVDPVARDRILEMIVSLRNKSRIVFLVEHDLATIKAVADRVLLMDRGQVVLDDTAEEVLGSKTVLEISLQINER
jgi:ABC-type branched-subunit amino acid transport system ATPase component